MSIEQLLSVQIISAVYLNGLRTVIPRHHIPVDVDDIRGAIKYKDVGVVAGTGLRVRGCEFA